MLVQQPSFGLPSSGDMVSCAAHRAPDHVDLKNNAKRCRAIEGCPKIALFGFRSEVRAEGSCSRVLRMRMNMMSSKRERASN
eukprot:3265109-Rhodomonas_salina.1